MKIKIVTDCNPYGYFLQIHYEDEVIANDRKIARLMGVSKKYYQNLFINKFTDVIHISENEIYINSEDDALEIAQWLQENIMSYILLKELNPNNIIGDN